jgi:hypothetical protein
MFGATTPLRRATVPHTAASIYRNIERIRQCRRESKVKVGLEIGRRNLVTRYVLPTKFNFFISAMKRDSERKLGASGSKRSRAPQSVQLRKQLFG